MHKIRLEFTEINIIIICWKNVLTIASISVFITKNAYLNTNLSIE